TTTGEDIGPYPLQDVKNPPSRAKDFSESDLHVDPTNPRHLIGVSKWIVNAEGYNHLTGFFESFDGGATWPQQGHIPGYEAWTDNSDPVGAFDPWGNFYAVVFPYMFSYIASGQHFFLSPDVNPTLPRSGLGVAVRPKGAASASTWNTTHGGQLDLIERTPFNGNNVFDKQWLAIDTNRHSRHFGRVYVSWAVGNDDSGLRIYLSYADARRNGTHTNWSRPRLVLPQAQRVGDNGSLPRVAPDGTVWLATSSFSSGDKPFTMSLTSSRNGGRTWARRKVIVRHSVNGYRNTSFRAAFGEAFIVGPRKVGRFYPLYAAYEQSSAGGTKVFLRGSFDGGRHWSPSRQVNDASGEGDALQPNLAVAPNGTVAVAFYDRRLPCPARDTTDATIAGLLFDPRVPFGAANYCINTAVQFYRPKLGAIGHNIRLSEHTWDPQLSSPRFDCICNPASFIGDYFGIDSRGGFTYTASVETFNAAGENPGYHQQQLVSKLRTP
ncbi:MAG TPA: exo-alpha-sialidase, partial [Gaiellaceae bacterium]